MTTVAVDETGTVAADTQLSANGYTVRVQKLFRMADGGVVTGCGDDWSLVYAAVSWLLAGEPGDPPAFRDCEILIVRPDGSVWLADGVFPAYPILDKAFAMGAGGHYARAALARGLSALDSVKEAAKLDIYTSEPIQTMTVCTPAELPGAVTHATTRKRA